jgi:hypothetical protein
LDPLILVEGKYDHAFLQEALRVIRPRRGFQIAYLEQLENAGGARGGTELLPYIKANARAIKSRSGDSSVIVVLDWDAAGKRDSFARLFGEEDPFRVFSWPETSFNPRLGNTFHGVERSYSDRLIQSVEAEGVQIFRNAEGLCAVEAAAYGGVKEKLFRQVQAGLHPEDLVHARGFVTQLVNAIGG